MPNLLTKAEIDALLGGPTGAGENGFNSVYRHAAEAAAAALTSLLPPGGAICLTAGFVCEQRMLRRHIGATGAVSLLVNDIVVGSPELCRLKAVATPTDAVALDEIFLSNCADGGDSLFAGYCHALRIFCERLCSLLAPTTAGRVPVEVVRPPYRLAAVGANEAATDIDETEYVVLELTSNTPQSARFHILVPPNAARACGAPVSAEHPPCLPHSPSPPIPPERKSALPPALAGIPLEIAVRVPVGKHPLGAVAGDGAAITVPIGVGTSVEVHANGQVFATGTIATQGDGYLTVQVRMPDAG